MYVKSWQTWVFILYIILVLYLSSTPGDDLSWFFQLWKYDKVVHFVEYLGVGFLLINALKIQPLRKSHWKFALMFLLLFPVLDEMLQYYTPSRIPDIYDGNGKLLYFGANAKFFPAHDVPVLIDDIIDLDSLTTETVVGYMFGGIAADQPNFGNNATHKRTPWQ